MLGSLIASRTDLQENMIVACFRQLIVISSIDLVFRCLRVLFLMAGGHVGKNQNLSSGKNSPRHVRHASPVTVQS